ncbi:MAG: metallopeptidase TldD-related protein [Polyangiaceae bacterium]|nr:metallopeptidase TldD-related protein [Polyangiaceae bacterium]
MSNEMMLKIAKQAISIAKTKGAQEAAAAASTTREIDVTWRDGKLEKISEATKRGLNLQLYVDGRYSSVSTSDLRPEGIESFIENAIALTRTLAQDPFRTLPDPALYKNQPTADLQIEDPTYEAVTAIDRRRMAADLEAAARSIKGAEAFLSVTSIVSDSFSESVRVHSNGFEGSRRETTWNSELTVSVKDNDGRRPEEYAWASTRFFKDLPDVASLGKLAGERALSRFGSKKIASAVLPMIVDRRSSGRLLSYFLRALSGSALQQKRSFLEGKLDQPIGSAKLDIEDDPLLPKGLGSRHFDVEGIAAKRLPIFKGGALRSYLVDTYYGKKLKMAPTTMNHSNLSWKLGDKSKEALIAEIKNGILVTRFLGGNSNDTTGDFSLGVQGFAIRGGKLAEPIAEMNISGSHLELWKHLVAVGNDPFPYSSSRTPSLVFDAVQLAGT